MFTYEPYGSPKMRILYSGLLTIFLSACAYPGTIDDQIVRFEIEESMPRITRVFAEKENGEMIVRGEVRFPRTLSHGHFTGHIDIFVNLPDGQVLERHNVDVHRKPSPKTYGRAANFVERLPIHPVKGTIIRVDR